MLVIITSFISIIAGVFSTVIYFTYFTKYLADPFTLDIFISNYPRQDDISFRITNNTDHSLATEVEVTLIVFEGIYSTQKFSSIVLNPRETLEKPLEEGDYNNIRNINTMYELSGGSYDNKRQPVKFRIRATFKNSRFKIMKFTNYIENLRAYKPRGKVFERVE